MASIGDIVMRMLLDGSDFQAQAKREGAKAGDAAGAAMSKNINNTLGGQLGKGIAQGLGIAGALGAANLASNAVGGVVDLINTSIDAASDLNETLSKGQVIFGEDADSIEAWAETAASSFGQSKRAAIDYASTFAGLFQTVGTADDEAAERAKRLTELGSDLASFFNTDVTDALQAIRSGLSGESEPLRRFNVFLSETAVTAKLAQLGIKKVGGTFTESQKATARYLLILEQTGAAQGDFARTSDGLANSQRILNAEMENLQATLGQEFLPIAKQVTEWQLDFVRGVGVAGDAVGGFANDVTKFIDGITPWEELTERQRKAAEASVLVADKWWQDEIPAAIAGGESAITDAAASALAGVPGAVEDTKKKVTKTAKELASEVADALRGERETIDSLIDELNERRTKPPISLTKEVEGLISTLLSPSLAADLVSSDPLTRAIARELKESIEERLGEIKLRPGVMADRVKEMLEKASTASNPVTRELAQDVGNLYVDSLVDAIGSSGNQAQVNAAVRALFDNVPDFVFTHLQDVTSPPDRVSRDGLSGTRAEGGPVWPGGAFWVGERGPEVFVPQDRGFIAPMARHEAFADGPMQDWRGTRPIEINMENVNLADAHDEFSLTQQLQFLASVG